MNLRQLGKIREQRGLTLPALHDKVGVRLPVLEAIERGAFGELPTGLYGRHAVRAYATAIGLDADELLVEVTPLLREAEDPLDGLARVRGFERKKVRLKPDTARVDGGDGGHGTSFKHGVAETRRSRSRSDGPASGAIDVMDVRIAGASAIDGAILALFAIALFAATARLSHASQAEAAAYAAPAVAMIVTVVSVLYFVMLGGVRQATFGQTIAKVTTEASSGAHDLHAIVNRGLECALRESSILIELYRSRYTRIAPELNASGKSIGCSVTR
jgi:hypothetical protein